MGRQCARCLNEIASDARFCPRCGTVQSMGARTVAAQGRRTALRDTTSPAARLPDELRDMVERELREGEKLLWVGQPARGRFIVESLPAFLFAIPWTAFAVFWIIGAAGFSMPDFRDGFDFFPLFGLPFVLVGLGMLSMPLWAMRRARRTVYAVTDRRAIVFDGGWWTTVASFTPEQLAPTHRRHTRGDRGDVIFGPQSPAAASVSSSPACVRGFLGVPDVAQVERLLRRVVEINEGRGRPSEVWRDSLKENIGGYGDGQGGAAVSGID